MKADYDLNLEARKYVDTVIRLVVFALLAFLCWRIVTPFVGLITWALVLAVALYPLHQILARKIGSKQGLTSTLMVIVTVLMIGTPTAFLALTVVDDIHTANAAMEAGGPTIPPPNASVADWPLIGEKVYKAWLSASTNMDQFLETYASQLKALSAKALGTAVGAVGATLLLLASMAVAGIMMAYGESGSRVMLQIANRLAGEKNGAELQNLSVATIRSVAMGVIGVAFFQALLFGIVFLVAGVPFPGLLALAVLITGIIQLPAIIFALPAILYVWMGGDGSTIFNVIMTVCFLVAGLSDNVLKPLLLGRGVKTPMPVILIGALGGMFAAGFIGLFLGAVILALCYEVFMGWIALSEAGYETEESGSNTETPAAE